MQEENEESIIDKIAREMPLFQRNYIQRWIEINESTAKALYQFNVHELLKKKIPKINVGKNIQKTEG